MALSKIQTSEMLDVPNLGRRNLVINGAMQVAQRGVTFDYDTPSGNKFTTCDRFSFFKSTGTYSLTNTQSTDAPVGFSHSYKVVCDATYTPSASDNLGINQNIEVSNGLQGFGFGTSEAKDITFSFYVKGTPKTYTFQTNYVGTDGEQKTQTKTFTVTNTWTRKVITFSAGGTSSSVGIETDQTSEGMNFRIWLASGPDDISSEITSWTANPSPTYKAATGQGNFFSNTGNEFLITGVQLEIGDIATPFEHRSFGEELSLCQRYYYTHITAGNGAEALVTTAASYNSTNAYCGVRFPVSMRAIPTIHQYSGTNVWQYYNNNQADLFNFFSMFSGNQSTVNQAMIYNAQNISITAGGGGNYQGANAACYLHFDAEL